MSQPVRFERIDGVGVITLENPPVNALSLALRTGIRDAVKEALEDDSLVALVVTGGGRMFCAGADITEFSSGVSNQPPTLPGLIELLEDSLKPVVAAVHGNAMGCIGNKLHTVSGKMRAGGGQDQPDPATASHDVLELPQRAGTQ